jgi:hypothetical protein
LIHWVWENWNYIFSEINRFIGLSLLGFHWVWEKWNYIFNKIYFDCSSQHFFMAPPRQAGLCYLFVQLYNLLSIKLCGFLCFLFLVVFGVRIPALSGFATTSWFMLSLLATLQLALNKIVWIYIFFIFLKFLVVSGVRTPDLAYIMHIFNEIYFDGSSQHFFLASLRQADLYYLFLQLYNLLSIKLCGFTFFLCF